MSKPWNIQGIERRREEERRCSSIEFASRVLPTSVGMGN